MVYKYIFDVDLINSCVLVLAPPPSDAIEDGVMVAF